MIYIVTIHHNTDKFIDLQDKYYAKYTEVPYKIYCGLSLPNNDDYFAAQREGKYSNFHFIDLREVQNQHWYRLNYLAEQVFKTEEEFDPDDILIFTDGDAFPVCPYAVPVSNLLQGPEKVGCVAVSRDENPEPFLADEFKPYPHPCFMATNLLFWKENELKWSLETPHIETAGPTLKRWYDEHGHNWVSMMRSNLYDLHPLYFGIYGDFLYHHGAGNRLVYDSIDIWPRQGLEPSVDMDLRFPQIPRFNKKLSDLIFDEIIADDNFINLYLMGRGSQPNFGESESCD